MRVLPPVHGHRDVIEEAAVDLSPLLLRRCLNVPRWMRMESIWVESMRTSTLSAEPTEGML